MTITVKGESYRSPKELRETIAELEGALESLPSESPQANDLRAHVGALQAALDSYLAGDGAEPAEAVSEGGETPSDKSGPEDEDELEAEPEAEYVPQQGTFPCPLCNGSGQLEREVPVSRHHLRCPECDGWGEVLTGSRLPEAARVTCASCEGRGHRGMLEAPLERALPTMEDVARFAETGELPDWARGPVR